MDANPVDIRLGRRLHGCDTGEPAWRESLRLRARPFDRRPNSSLRGGMAAAHAYRAGLHHVLSHHTPAADGLRIYPSSTAHQPSTPGSRVSVAGLERTALRYLVRHGGRPAA